MAKRSSSSGGDGTKLIAQNRRARYDYHLEDRYEAGIALTGTEVKALRAGKASLVQAWVKIDDRSEAWLIQAHIEEYDHGNRWNHDPTRERKLLLHKREIERLAGMVKAKGVSLIPTRMYFRDGKAKVEFAVARGKNVADKRRDVAKRDAQREIERAIKTRR